MITQLLYSIRTFFENDPTVAGPLMIACALFLAAVIYAVKEARREEREEAQAAQFERDRRAREPVKYPPPKGPKGFNRNGRMAS